MIPLLVSEKLKGAGFAHGFSTRLGGVSVAPHDALDFATLRDPERLRENQRRLAAAVGFDVARFYQAKQVHGRGVLVSGGDPAAMLQLEADAIVGEAGTRDAVCVRVADCVPVLLADTATGRVAAAHAGWRGVVAGVVPAALEKVGADPAKVIAAIGPCIGPCCFEVGVEVGEEIARATSADAIARRDDARGKAYVDLRRAVREQLRGLGVSEAAIEDVPGTGPEGCTRCDADRYYSYRRDGDASGRLVGVIVAR